MKGGSGISAKMTMIVRPERQVAITTSMVASNMHQYAEFHSGVYRGKMKDGWRNGQRLPLTPWPKPRTWPFDDAIQSKILTAHADGNSVAMLDVAGWPDISCNPRSTTSLP